MRRLFILLFFLPLFASAQPAVTRPVAGVASTTDGATYSFGSFTPAANSLLVVMVCATGSVLAAPTITNTGTTLTWTRVASQVAIGNGNGYHIFWAKCPATTSASVITFNCTGDNATGATMSIHQFTGYNTVGPIRQTFISSATTASTNARITFSTPLLTGNSYVIGWCGLLGANTSTAPTTPVAWTESDDVAFATPATNMSTARRAGGITTAGVFTFTNATTTWIVMGFEVAAPRRSMPLSMIVP